MLKSSSVALSIVGLATALGLAACGGETTTEATPNAATQSPATTESAPLTDSTLAAPEFPVDANGCAYSPDGSPIGAGPDVTCVNTTTGNMTLLYSLARDDISEARLNIVDGEKETAVPLTAPEEDGGFLMGFVSDVAGQSTVEVYVTTESGEEKVQTVTVNVTPKTEVADTAGGMTFGFSESDAPPSTGGDWIDPQAP